MVIVVSVSGSRCATQTFSKIGDDRQRYSRPRAALPRRLRALFCSPSIGTRPKLIIASKTWRKSKGENRLPMVIAGVKFTDGVAITATPDQHAA
ncbi:hypothetical protein [Aurantimonas sp. A2-1-M11]|uniref:hypothetical protein n=1 Tax=Aurantimonas sp. A2-1-M11 TaxID=3113712 RepID=UPI002F91C203